MNHILVIRLSAMGDVAISIPVLTAFRAQYPSVKLTILTRPLFVPLFSHLSNCEVLTIDVKNEHKGIIGLWKLFKELRKLDIHAVADIHNVLRTNVLKMFFSFTNIPFKQINKGRKEKKQLFRAKNKIFKQLRPSYLRYADVFEELGFPINMSELYFAPKPIISEQIQTLLLPHKKYIGIAPFAAHWAKQYSFENLKEIILLLSKNTDYQIFIFGGGEYEKNIIEEVVHLPNIHNMVGKFSFREELQLISRLDVMLAMDSGNAHLSAIYGVQTITLWGVTHPYAGFYPYGQPLENALLADREQFPQIPTSAYGNKYPYGYERAINTISTKDIIEKLYEIINH